MAYLPGFEYDIFITYSRRDDETGWVSALRAELEREVNRHLESDQGVRIFLDREGFSTGDRLTDAVKQAIESSAMLLPVVSHDYLRSQWCSLERDSFLGAGGEHLFPVWLRPYAVEELPEALRDCLATKLYKEDGRGRPKILGWPAPSHESHHHVDYFDVLGDLAWELSERLQDLHARASAAEHRTSDPDPESGPEPHPRIERSAPAPSTNRSQRREQVRSSPAISPATGPRIEPPPGDVSWAKATGSDEYGTWADIRIEGHGKVAEQRLRWIPPGRFLMGSPESEVGREDHEFQHPVELTQGFWLGDTAVTQALWLAVMSEKDWLGVKVKNPSNFKGDELPVETVSWEVCQVFLAKLGEQLPGFHPRLPSEAQWECACRAGTSTPFNFGAALDMTKANYDGNCSYADDPKGEYRERTLPVRSFAPNAWGLYQMHGNVWEWCVDRLGDYPTGAAIDPTGPADGQYRVLRGGSWIFSGRYLRSAYRYALRPGSRYRFIGLRLAGGSGP